MNSPDPNPTGREQPQSDAVQGNLWGGLLSVSMLGAVFWPIQENWKAEPQDSFPLSYYPMFSQKREPIEAVYYVAGYDAQGGRYYVPRKWIGQGGQNQVRKQMRRMIKEDRASDLARSVAKKLADQSEEPWSRVVSVSVVSGEFVMNDFFHGKKDPVAEKILGTKIVKRKGAKGERNPTD